MRGLLATLFLVLPGLLQAAPQALDLDALLEQVRGARALQGRENSAREAAFRAAREDQARLLEALKTELAAEEERGNALKATLEANRDHLDELEARLHEQAGVLGEVFGTVRQNAGELRAQLADSLTALRHPGRDAFLGELERRKALPSIGELERLWFLLQQEMTEAGRVERFSAMVVGRDGTRRQRDVIRIGVFNAVADGRYLRFHPETGTLAELERQPSTRYLKTLRALERGDREAPLLVALDPTRGSLLELLIKAPDLRERIQSGGAIGYVILALGAIGLLLVVERLLYLGWVGRRMRRQLREPERPTPDNPLGRVLSVWEGGIDIDPETLESRLDEAILREGPILERGRGLIKLLAAVAPLLGLLGTVTGMINTFQAISLFGTGDPRMMAGGISQALVTTMLGLATAIPLLFLHTLVSARSRALIQILDEQSAGLVARMLEARR